MDRNIFDLNWPVILYIDFRDGEQEILAELKIPIKWGESITRHIGHNK